MTITITTMGSMAIIIFMTANSKCFTTTGYIAQYLSTISGSANLIISAKQQQSNYYN